MDIRSYGSTGPAVVLLHGGPGAGGYLGPLARGLEDAFRVLEPMQRGSGDRPLTVATHVADLDALLEARVKDDPPALVGHSWGAMLALAYAAAHPGRLRSLVLIGCGGFDTASRERLHERIEARMTRALRDRVRRLRETCPDADERLRRLGNLLLPVYSRDPIVEEIEGVICDARAYDESWADMLRLQAAGIYPAAFAAIDPPVLMLHGAEDPHPGAMIRDTLARHVRRLAYREWEDCGHYPWLERSTRETFFETLRTWLREASPLDAESAQDTSGKAHP